MGWYDVFRSRRMAVLFLLGFGSGLPPYLTAETLQAWLTSAGLPLAQIAAFSTVGLAYTFKFMWAPLLDWYRLPFLGRRRGWILVFQIGLVVAIAAMGTIDPLAAPGALFALAVVVAVLSASHDVVIDGYNADILTPEQRAAGASLYIIGYRAAILVSSAVAFVMADYVAWSIIYVVMAGLMGVGILGTVLAEEPPAPERPPGRGWRALKEVLLGAFIELFRRFGWRGSALVIAFVALYKFGDYLAQSFVIAFLKRGVGFEFTEIAAIYQLLGYVGIAVGGLTAGTLVARFGLRRMLIAFGLLQAITNLLYAGLALAGNDLVVFSVAVLVDNLANAMGTAAFVAFLMSVCSPAVSATQFALLTSLSSVGRRVFGGLADDIVAVADWSGFFAITAALALPGLVLAWFVARDDR